MGASRLRRSPYSLDCEYSQMVVRVFQALIAFSGNAPPQLAVTRELVERGHEVRVLAHRATRDRIEHTGAEFVEFRRALPAMDVTRRETDTLRDWEARTPVGYVRALLKNTLFAFVEDVARDCVELLEDRSEEHTSELQSPCNLV